MTPSLLCHYLSCLNIGQCLACAQASLHPIRPVLTPLPISSQALVEQNGFWPIDAKRPPHTLKKNLSAKHVVKNLVPNILIVFLPLITLV